MLFINDNDEKDTGKKYSIQAIKYAGDTHKNDDSWKIVFDDVENKDIMTPGELRGVFEKK